MDSPDNSLIDDNNKHETYSESVTDGYNTADLSNLSGLSKILKADDSIADKVRCLLEDDNYASQSEKPALLCSSNENIPTDGELKERMLTLFKDEKDSSETPIHKESVSSEPVDAEEENNENASQNSYADAKEDLEERKPELIENDNNSVIDIYDVSIPTGNRDDLGEPAGNGVDEKPIPVRQDSSDDIMNISDSTEYSDLPKVVDNPMKNSRSNLASNSYPVLSEYMKKISSNESSSIDNSNAKIAGDARFYSDSDPNTPQFSDDPEKLKHLEKYVQRRNQEVTPSEPSRFNSKLPGDARLEALRSGGPIHSTPYVHSRQMEPSNLYSSEAPTKGQTPVITQKLDRTESLITPSDRRCSQENNITLRSRASDIVNSESTLDIQQESLSSSVNVPMDVLTDLEDEEIIKKVKQAVSQDNQTNFSKSTALRGPHTASEYSIASTVDSLAAQVKTLLREESAQQHMVTENLSDVNINDVSHNSNFSDEISNFEKTNLWKYTRQFLPGAMTPSREIQPLTKFVEPSPMRNAELVYDSSNMGSPDTYRLPNKEFCPESLSNSKFGMSPLAASSSNRETVMNDLVGQIKNQSVTSSKTSNKHPSKSTPNLGESLLQTHPIKDVSIGKSPSRIVGRYDSYSKEVHNIFTPHSVNYQRLEPEVNQTQTPYSFITPRKVAWEEPNKVDRVPVVKYKSPLPKPIKQNRAPLLQRNRDTHERSSYFNKERLVGERPLAVEKSPNISERPSTVKFQKLTPERDTTIKTYEPTSSAKNLEGTCGYTSEDHITVKSLTPPRSRESNRHIPEYQPHTLELSSSLNIQAKKSPNPKSVHFKDFSNSSSLKITPDRQLEQSIRLRQYSFTTPRVSGNPTPKNITPKVIKEKPRVGRVLPTFDQLVAEKKLQENQESTKEVAQASLRQKNLLPKTGMQSKTSLISYPNEDPKIDLTHSDFLPLKPEICANESDEEQVSYENLSTPPVKRRGENLNLSVSDTELHRRTTLSQSSSDSDDDISVPSLNFGVKSSKLYPEIVTEIRSASDSENMTGGHSIPCPKKFTEVHTKGGLENFTDGHTKSSPKHFLERRSRSDRENFTDGHTRNGSENSAEERTGNRFEDFTAELSKPGRSTPTPRKFTEDRTNLVPESFDGTSYTSPAEEDAQQSDTSSSSTPIEPAPLPYVRLGKQKRNMSPMFSVPLRHSISTEKVQHLLMKEKNVGNESARTRSTVVSSSMPVANVETCSSDEELMNLLETFSTKVPLMEKLLRKLYEKNLRKKPVQLKNPESIKYSRDEQALIDRSVQTAQHDNSVLRNTSTNIPQARKTNLKKLYAESSSQTSSNEKEIIKKSLKPDKACKQLLQRQRNNDWQSQDKNDDFSSGEGKENVPRKPSPCAFFVDLTPEKMPKKQDEETVKHSPVAWYEPYEYIPPWKQRSSMGKPKMGFVNANIQDAFLDRKRDFVLRSWERQEDIALRAEERKLKELEEKIQEQILALHNEKAQVFPTPPPLDINNAAYNNNKSDRVFGWKEMRMSSKLKYQSLPEVVARKREAERKKYYEANRKRALQYKRKITQIVLQKQKSKSPTGMR